MTTCSVERAFLAVLAAASMAAAFSLFSLDNRVNSLRLGEAVHAPGARYLGMGGAGLALSDSVNWNAKNPAAYARMDYTSISISYFPEITYLQDQNAAGTFRAFTNDFPNAELVIPTGKYGVVYAGYIRDRLLDYEVGFLNGAGDSVRRYGQGGTYTLRGGYAYEYKKMLSGGFSVGERFGSTRTGQSVTALGYPSYSQKLYLSVYMAEFGLLARYKKFSAAVSGALPVGSVRTERTSQIIQNYTGSDSIVTLRNDAPSMDDQVPLTGAVGLAYAPNGRINLAADLSGVLWDAPDRKKEYRASLGAEFFFSGKRSEHYYLNIPLRAGYYYHQLGYLDDICEQGITLGWTLPTAGHFGFLNFALEGGKRYLGSLSQSSITETYTRLSVQLVHKGRWGRLRKAAESEF